MRVAVIFFLSLFFQVLASRDSASASFRHCDIRSAADNLQKAQQAVSAKPTGSYLFTNDVDSGAESDDVLNTEDEDEDEDIIRKHLLPAAHFLVFSYTFISSDLCNCRANRLSFYQSPFYTGFCKYISQKALRL